MSELKSETRTGKVKHFKSVEELDEAVEEAS